MNALITYILIYILSHGSDFPSTSCVTLGKLFTHSKPQVPHLVALWINPKNASTPNTLVLTLFGLPSSFCHHTRSLASFQRVLPVPAPLFLPQLFLIPRISLFHIPLALRKAFFKVTQMPLHPGSHHSHSSCKKTHSGSWNGTIHSAQSSDLTDKANEGKMRRRPRERSKCAFNSPPLESTTLGATIIA